MYFPYLYGRRSEFLALRAMLDDPRPLDLLIPIVEPVNQNIRDLEVCIEAFQKQGAALAVVLNPNKHQLKEATARDLWTKQALALVQANDTVFPTFICRAGRTLKHVEAFIARFPGRHVVIAFASPELTDAEVKTLAANAGVSFFVVMNGKMTTAQQALLPKAKRVDVRDDFNKLERNADYNGVELFTDRNVTYKTNCVGFGDYASIGAAFNATGSQPAAVAIHAVFKHASGHIWIEHFVSDDKEKSVGDVASKFLQAAGKLVKAVKARPKAFGSNRALDAFADSVKTSHFPGLPTNKVLQIQHHLCLTLDVISGAL